MNKILKCIEKIIQIITVISGIRATIEIVKVYTHKKQLKQKANEYLDDELALDGSFRGNIDVYSPSLEIKEKQVRKLLIVTVAGAIASVILNLINKERY